MSRNFNLGNQRSVGFSCYITWSLESLFSLECRCNERYKLHAHLKILRIMSLPKKILLICYRSKAPATNTIWKIGVHTSWNDCISDSLVQCKIVLWWILVRKKEIKLQKVFWKCFKSLLQTHWSWHEKIL